MFDELGIRIQTVTYLKRFKNIIHSNKKHLPSDPVHLKEKRNYPVVISNCQKIPAH